MIRQRAARAPNEEKTLLPALLFSQHRQDRKTRSACRPVLLCIMLVAVIAVQTIDILAIFEYPDPISEPSDVVLVPKTIILMIETRDPPPDTVCINELYAIENGYDFELITHHWCFDKYRNRFGKFVYLWCRPLIFQDALKTHESLFYLDSDAYFVNPEMSIESFFSYAKEHNYFSLNQGKKTTFVGAEDCGTPHLANGGIQFWRKTQFSDRMLTTWFLSYRHQFILYWLRISWLPNYEIHYFSNREQGAFQVAVQENPWMERETSLVRHGKETWHNCWLREDTFFLNHFTTNFGVQKRKESIAQHVHTRNITCIAGRMNMFIRP